MEELTRKKSQLQQRLRHIPADSLGSRILKDVVVGGGAVIHLYNTVGGGVLTCVRPIPLDIPATSLPTELQREVCALNLASTDRLYCKCSVLGTSVRLGVTNVLSPCRL